MKKLKRIASAIAVVVGLTTIAAPAHATGIPVVDIAGDLQNLLSHIEDLAQYIEQLEMLEQQYQQMQAQYEKSQQMYQTMTGSRGMAALINSLAARQYLPRDSATLYNLSTNGGSYSSLAGSLKAIKQAAQIVKPSDIGNSTAASSLDKRQSILAGMQTTAEAAYDQAGQRFDRLQVLVDSVDTASDAKAAADLQNRIQAEQVMMQNEQAKIAMMAQVQKVQQEQLDQQNRERLMKFGQSNQAVYVSGF